MIVKANPCTMIALLIFKTIRADDIVFSNNELVTSYECDPVTSNSIRQKSYAMTHDTMSKLNLSHPTVFNQLVGLCVMDFTN